MLNIKSNYYFVCCCYFVDITTIITRYYYLKEFEGETELHRSILGLMVRPHIQNLQNSLYLQEQLLFHPIIFEIFMHFLFHVWNSIACCYRPFSCFIFYCLNGFLQGNIAEVKSLRHMLLRDDTIKLLMLVVAFTFAIFTIYSIKFFITSQLYVGTEFYNSSILEQ